jgi:hypothetical protein
MTYVCNPKPALPPKPMAKAKYISEKEQDKILNELRDLLAPQFRPVPKGTTAEHMLTTDEIFHVVDNHAPDLVPKHILRDLLLSLGYEETYLGTQFVWLMSTPT